MKLSLYSVRDSKAGVFLAPWPARSDADAQRSITEAFSLPGIQETPLYKHPEDFSLYVMAVFDDETGSIDQDAPRQIATISTLVPTAQLPS